MVPICSSLPSSQPTRRSSVKVVVDFDECASNAVCMGIVPEVFEVRDDGYLYVLNEHPPEELRERLREAVNGCPTGAISILEED
jgi:ferredoxin